MLELRRISKLFAGIPAVYDVSFSAMPGAVTGYLGPNGSGKSTTMKMLAGVSDHSFSTSFHKKKLTSCDAQPLLRILERASS